MTVPRSLTDPDLNEVWSLVRSRLERSGIANRGRIKLPDLSPRSRQALSALIDCRLASTLDLGLLEEGLARVGVGNTLPVALEALGAPVSAEPEARRAARRLAELSRSRARDEASTWPEPWAERWIDEVIRARLISGLEPDRAIELVVTVRRVLDHVPLDGPRLSRTDLAAIAAGSAHALDDGTRLGGAVERALGHRLESEEPAAVWELAGVHKDKVSAPALTWRLTALPGNSLEPLLSAATRLTVPLHLSQFALRQHPIRAARGLDVLVVENPRVIEAAAQRQVDQAMVCTNGNPSTAVRLLIDQLLESGAVLRYSGDFDPAGLAICERMRRIGLRPWKMGSHDYLTALGVADRQGVSLPISERKAGPTPWDPALQRVFNSHRAVVHQERLLEVLLVTRGMPEASTGWL